MSTVIVTVNCQLAPLPTGRSLRFIQFDLTDAGGTKSQQLQATQIAAAQINKPDGSVDIPVTFNLVASGPYTVKVQAFGLDMDPMGSPATGSGTMPAGMGASFPQAATFVFANS